MDKKTPRDKIKERIALEMKIREEERAESRRRRNMDSFLGGDTKVLENQEFVRYLISCFQRESCPDPMVLGDILDALIGVVYRGDEQAREKAIFILFYACEFFLDGNLSAGLLCCNFVTCEWLREEEEMLSGFDAVLQAGSKVIQRLAESGYLEEVAETLLLFDDVRSGRLPKSPPFTAMINRRIKTFGNDRFFRAVFRSYPENRSSHLVVENLLDWFGEACIPALVAKVASCSDRTEKAALLEILRSFGDKLSDGLEFCLKGKPPASVVKAVLSIFADIGDDKHYPLIESLFSYPDFYVQQEALAVVRALDEKKQRSRFLDALPLVKEKLQLDLLGYLLAQNIYDDDLYNLLILLASRRASFSMETGIDLLALIVTALGHYPNEQTLDLLVDMRQDYEQTVGGAHIVMLIDNTLSSVRPQLRHEKQAGGEGGDFLRSAGDEEGEEDVQAQGSRFDAVEAQVQEMIDNDDESGAGKFIYERALEAVDEKRFDLAAYLKTRLLEVDPFALAEAMKIGELLEDQGMPAVAGYQEEVWKNLLETLSEQEFNTLYANSVSEIYNKGDIIIESGDMDRCLFLLNSGCISLSCQTGGLERFLRRVNPGMVLGSEQFFDASIWTISLKALTPVQVQVVSQQGWGKILESAPDIQEKLRSYCRHHLNIPQLLSQSGDDRRATVRYVANLQSRHIVIDPLRGSQKRQSFFGSKQNQSAGTLLDLSQGGLAATLRIASREQAMELLGKQLLTTLDGFDGQEPLTGLVVGVRLHDPFARTYVVHVKLAEELSGKDIVTLLQSAEA